MRIDFYNGIIKNIFLFLKAVAIITYGCIGFSISLALRLIFTNTDLNLALILALPLKLKSSVIAHTKYPDIIDLIIYGTNSNCIIIFSES